MIVMGGIQYMTSELVSGKAAGKETIMQAILGLLLALGAYAILNTLNPDLLDIGLKNLPTATIEIGNTSIDGVLPNGNCNPEIGPETADGLAIVAKADGAQGASCFGGAMVAYVKAGYAIGSQQNGSNCPTSVAKGDVLEIDNNNNQSTSRHHNVIFDSILDNGNWKVWSQDGAPPKNVMYARTYTAEYMRRTLIKSWKPTKCPPGKAQMITQTGEVTQIAAETNGSNCQGSGVLLPESFNGVSKGGSIMFPTISFNISNYDRYKEHKFKVSYIDAYGVNKSFEGTITYVNDNNKTGSITTALVNEIKNKTVQVNVTTLPAGGTNLGNKPLMWVP
jgi:hypothetical protein